MAAIPRAPVGDGGACEYKSAKASLLKFLAIG